MKVENVTQRLFEDGKHERRVPKTHQKVKQPEAVNSNSKYASMIDYDAFRKSPKVRIDTNSVER